MQEARVLAMTYLSTLFEREKADVIVVDGRRIYGILRIPVASPSLLKVRRLHASSAPVPGLRVKTHDGSATLNGDKVRDLILWSDTAPEEIEINIIPKRKKIAEIRMWHCWRDRRDGYDITEAWVLNDGMLVEHSNNEWILRCNSGPNAALSFDDLIVAVHVITQ